jgi:hypothetical protein
VRKPCGNVVVAVERPGLEEGSGRRGKIFGRMVVSHWDKREVPGY